MDVKIIMKNHLQQKTANIFHQVFQYLLNIVIKEIENKHNVYRGKYCMKKSSENP